MKTKIIAITAAISPAGKLEPMGFGVPNQRHCVLDTDYTDAIIRAGAMPLVVSPSTDAAHFKRVCEIADGLLLTGGQDISPRIYGVSVSADCGVVSSERDAYELAILREFYEHTNKPIFGICRGLQLLNAFLGGSLHQHLPAAGINNHSISTLDRWNGVHEVSADADLAGIIGARAWVNSFHHQGIKDLAPCFEAIARADDGLIEAVRAKGERLIAAVQWHPEMMALQNAQQQGIFEYFIKHC